MKKGTRITVACPRCGSARCLFFMGAKTFAKRTKMQCRSCASIDKETARKEREHGLRTQD